MSFLRTGKLVRYFAGLTRNVVHSVRDGEGTSLLQNSPCVCSQFQHSFASNASPKTDLSLDKQLQRLDNDVRRIGRISRRDIEDVLEEIRLQRSATSSQSLLVIRYCGSLVPEELPERRTALVQEIWKTLNALNIPMDISHYNALLRVYLENEHPFSPTDFLAEIESKSIEPNRVTYQRLIARYCQQGDIEGATRILEYMREKNLAVNENVFNSLILGHSEAKDMESAKGILSVMKQAGLEPSPDTYTTLLCCYARHGDLDSITATLAECQKNEVFLLDKDLLDVAYTLAINGHSDRVDSILSNLRLSMGFNQDAVNTILRLVNKGYEDVGLKILRVMPRSVRPDGSLIDAGSFLIKQLMKANRPIEKVLSVCKTLQNEGLNSKALLIATEAGLTNGLVDNTLPLLKEMSNAGFPIRQHYFWPLMSSVSPNEVIEILNRMQQEFGIVANAETIRDYVIPNLKEKNWEKIIHILRDAGISNGNAASSAAYAALTANNIVQAAAIMESNRAYYSPFIFRQPLIHALSNTMDYQAFNRVVRQIYENFLNRKVAQSEQESEVEGNEAESANDEHVPDIVGSILMDVTVYFRSNRVDVLENILPGLVEQGISISSGNATRVSERIGSELTTKISELLGKLSSGELELVPLQNSGLRKRGLDSMTVDELERFVDNIEARGENAQNVKRFLLAACFRNKNLEKALQVIEKYEAEGQVLSVGINAQLIDLYAYRGKTAEALTLFNKLKSEQPDFQLDNFKTVRLVNLLVDEDRMDEALNFLDINKKVELATDSDTFNYQTTVWRLLNSLAASGETEKLELIFNTLISGKYILANNVLLGPLIKVHLVKDNIPKAIEAFEQICETYKCTPWKNEIACRLIQLEDATNLQRITDLSTNIHGEVNSLYDLVFSFVECGRIRQARKILETPGLRTRPYRIDNACERYKNEGLVQPLEGLVEATKDLNHIDRNKIYYNLLLSYCKSNDAEKGLGLWTKMQEEDIPPSDAFLIQLGDLLKKNNMPIPFVLPKSQVPVADPASRKEEKTPNRLPKVSNLQITDTEKPAVQTNLFKFRKALNAGQIDEAINYKSEMTSSEMPTIVDMSRLIEYLVREGRIAEATKYMDQLLQAKRYPLAKVFKFYLNKLAAAGDVDRIQYIGDLLTDEQKRIMSFDNRFCHANIVAGKVEQYFKKLDDEISNVKSSEEAANLALKFPRGGAVGILEKHPEMIPKYEKLAEKYAEHKQLGPINVLWMHLISNGDEAASKAIWDKHLSNAPRLMFQRVLQTAREQKDPRLAEAVLSQLRGSKISEGAIGNAYSCVIDILNGNNEFDKALETLKTAVKDVCLENINRTALMHLKLGLEEQKKHFPFDIPEKKNKADSSSSSSSTSNSDDVTPGRPETKPGPGNTVNSA